MGFETKYYFLTAGLLGVCTVIGLIVAYRFQRDVSEDLVPPNEKELFDPLEKAFFSGLMDEAEYKRIKESMAKQKGGDKPAALKRPKPAPKPVEPEPSTVEEEPETDEE